MSLKILAIGEAMAEISGGEQEGFCVGFAGDTYNTAVYCARLLEEPGRVGYMTRVGGDPLSTAFCGRLKDEGLTAKITEDPKRNLGIYSVLTDSEGERAFHYWRNQSAARNLFSSSSDFEQLKDAQIIYLSAITLAILSPEARNQLAENLEKLTGKGKALFAFDSNYRPNLWESIQLARETISRFWEIAQIALPSIDDEMKLYDETPEAVIARFSNQSWVACAIKRGPLGPLSPTLPADEHPNFSPVTNVVDTTAAGDGFNAGYLTAYIEGKDEAACLLSGHDLASQIVQLPGAIAPR